MADLQKLVWMIQPSRFQGQIWQAVLKSQKLAVIWEASNKNLVDTILQFAEAGLALPNVLLVDVGQRDFHAYEFCRWCRESFPDIRVVLTNCAQESIIPAERRWAMNQGAADLLPGFQRYNLVASVTTNVRRLLELLGDYPLDNGSLIAVLLAMKRSLEARDPNQIPKTHNQGTSATAFLMSQQSTTGLPQADVPLPKALPSTQVPSTQGSPKPPAPLPATSQTQSVSQPAHDQPEEALPEDDDQPTDGRPVRRYRGVVY